MNESINQSETYLRQKATVVFMENLDLDKQSNVCVCVREREREKVGH